MKTKSLRPIAALSALVVAIILTLPQPGQAQQVSTPNLVRGASVPTSIATPMVDSITPSGPQVMQAGFSRHMSDHAAPMVLASPSDRNNIAWMAVGGAALVVGLMIGGDGGTIIALTGGVVGLVGLFRHMQ